MRLAVDAFNLPHDHRGMGRHVRAILARLPAYDYECDLIVRNREDQDAVREEMPGKDVLLLKDAQRRDYDGIWYPWNGKRFELNAPAVLTVHDLFAFQQPHGNVIARMREQGPINRGIREAEGIATVSEWSKSQIVLHFGIDPARILIIPPVLDPYWKPAEPKHYDVPYVLFVGGPEKRKNTAMMIQAFEDAFPERDVMLVIAGALCERDEQLLADSGLRYERVRPDDEELRSLFSGASVVAVPSTLEGYGLVALEAMACGAPVVAADTAALPEACGGAAILVTPKDSKGWSDAVRRVVRDPVLQSEMRQRSLARAAAVDREAPARVMNELLMELG